MKRNAIIRIVLWSVVLVVLLAMLFIGMFGIGWNRRIAHPIEETMAPVPLTEVPVTAPTEKPVPDEMEPSAYNAVATGDLNIRSMPDTLGEVVGMAEKGTGLQITRKETINGTPWGFVTTPIQGWVVMEYVDLLDEIPEEQADISVTTPQEVQPAHANAVSMDALDINSFEIEWAAGSITIQPKDVDTIYIMEDGLSEDSEPMVWNVRNGRVYIQYSKKVDRVFGMGLLSGDKGKDLIIQVPFDWQCTSLEIDAGSASVKINDLTIRNMEFDGASGTCVFDNCTVEKLDLDTASGDVLFKGSLNQLECDSASANIVLELNNVPRALELDTASGDLDVTLPKNAGFTVSMDTLSSNFESDFDTVRRNDSYIAGDGSCRIEVDAMSGRVNIRKGA